MEPYFQTYGDLLFDLCTSVIWNPAHVQIAFQSILKKIRSGLRFQTYSTFERSWVLKVACERLLLYCHRYGYRVSPNEQIKLDSNISISNRLKQFESYFHRLNAEDQILLLLKDKYEIPYSEIANAMSTPEGALKVRRQQALRTLEEWLWNSR